MRNFDNVSYVSFIKHSKNSFIRIFTAVTTGIIDAIEKDYVRILLLPCYYPHNTNICYAYPVITIKIHTKHMLDMILAAYMPFGI